MPFADRMPTVVFPETQRGHDAWGEWPKTERTVPYFCNEYSPDDHAPWKSACSRRNPSGVRAKSLCFRCVSGFLYDFDRSVRQSEDETRLKA